jgi:uncharacterized protein (DUF2237 family)
MAMSNGSSSPKPRNVLGGELEMCCKEPLTGFFRDGYCRTNDEDLGLHVICAEVTELFLNYSRARGNDLITPRPEYRFPGLKPGDRWCVCAARWLEAYKDGVAPKVVLAACHEKALEVVPLDTLKRFAIDGDVTSEG